MESMNVCSNSGIIRAARQVSISTQKTKDMYASQRALELRKFYDPYQADINPHSSEDTLNGRLNSDGALDSYAEVTIWRLGGVHSMISIIDGSTQYFIAGARRDKSSPEDDIVNDSWFGCFQVPSPGGLCENTLAINNAEEDPYPCFIVEDLKNDPRFANLSIVDGSMASYVWYAGAPITTKNGINIGVLCVFGDRPTKGFNLERRKFLYHQANNIMKYIETQREANERHRVALMSKGTATFLERTSRCSSTPDNSYFSDEVTADMNNGSSSVTDNESRREDCPSERSYMSSQVQNSSESVLDQIRITLDHAAEILRESLELDVGGVVFLDTTAGYTEVGNTDAYLDTSTDLGTEMKEIESRRSSADNEERQRYDEYRRRLSQATLRTSTVKHKPAKILSMSTAKVATWDSEAHVLDGKTLQALINSYPKGNIWYIDDNGYFSSLEQVKDWKHSRANGTNQTERPRTSNSPFDSTKQEAEANMLAKIFHKARQIIFLPLWDSGGERWYSTLFVWSQSPVPVFTVNNEISYLSAFTSSVMVEISRLDALISNKMKSDFISSISHEFRSPLHGILASADFLRESNLDTSQTEFVSTIQNCSGTLLDTINHVLDYSKINSFQKTEGSLQGSFSNELHQVTNVALLCEDTINGMIAANHFRSVAPMSNLALSNGSPNKKDIISLNGTAAPLQIILDFETRDWTYKVHAGAIQRILMNIFGNSLKYTDEGFIQVQLRLQEQKSGPDVPASSNQTRDYMYLRIKDSGRGMSTEYMERKLYHPFAQENSFTPGVGLGLSIVWSIVKQLGGTILVRSEVGIGTDVEVRIPVEKPEPCTDDDLMSGDIADSIDVRISAEKAIRSLRDRATGKVISLDRGQLGAPQSHAWDCIQKYCSEWYGFDIIKSDENVKTEDLLLINETSTFLESQLCRRVLVVHDAMSYPSIKMKDNQHFIAHISQPIGPYRLARSILALLDQTSSEPSHKDATTQTPLASPNERFGNGGEYSFLPLQGPEPDTVNEVTLTSADRKTREEFAESLKRLEQLQLQAPAVASPQTTPIATPKIPENTSSIPIPIQPPPLPPVGPQARVAPEKTPLHILAVDDNALNLQLIHRYLQKRKTDTIVDASDGLEAVAAVKASEHGFDVIFMDISMPKMDGFEATRLIRGWEVEKNQCVGLGGLLKWGTATDGEKQIEMGEMDRKGGKGSARAYIVAMTGLGSQKARDEADRSGFDDFMTKPVKLPRVGELLKRLSCEKAARCDGEL